MSQTIYSEVTDRIIAALERGVAPWQRPWVGSSIPHNLITHRPYRGINVLLLSVADYPDPRWMTFLQAKQLGAKVRRGEHGTRIVFRRWIETDEVLDDGTRKQVCLLRTFVVFNTAQVDGLDLAPIEASATATDDDACERARGIAAGYLAAGGPRVVGGAAQAAYSPATDTVMVPAISQCVSAAAYYAVLNHELVHSTGHPTRLQRPGVSAFDHFGSDQYSREELIAEMGSAFLCGAAGLEARINNSASYLQCWIRVLRGDGRLVVQAASEAQRAADYILGAGVGEQEA